MPSNIAGELINATQGLLCGGLLDALSPPRRVHSRARAVDADGNKVFVVNRHGDRVAPRWDEITDRIEELCSARYGRPLPAIDAPAITTDVIRRFKSGMTTREIDLVIVQVCAANGSMSADWLALAARVCVSDLHKRSPASMRRMMDDLVAAAPDTIGAQLSEEFLGVVHRFADEIDRKLDFSRDYDFDIFGFQTIARAYLLKSGDAINESTLATDQLMERPQHWYMREALLQYFTPDGRSHELDEATARARLADAFAHYDRLSLKLGSHATPTLLNTGKKPHLQQLSSCFQLGTADSIKGFGDSWRYAADISKLSGGESHWMSAVRAEGSRIRGTGGRSQGLRQLLRVYNEVQRLADQGGNRPGAFAMYLEVWHADVLTFLKMGRTKGVADNAPHLKYALVVCDAFMRALEADGDWHLMCPDECPGLYRVHGKAFEELYERYIREGRFRRKVKAREIAEEHRITLAQIGNPYVVNKDAMNAKSNMQHIGTVCSSNLCTETALLSFPDEEAKYFGAAPGEGEHGVCNLAALCLESFLVEVNGKTSDAGGPCPPRIATMDFGRLIEEAGNFTVALDKVIDITFYPTEQSRRANTRHRPVGLGVMGLANVFARMKLAYGSREAVALDQAIAAAIYYGAVRASARRGAALGSYPTFAGSPISRGILQPDMWAARGELAAGWEVALEKYLAPHVRAADWAELREAAKRAMRNGYVTAYMPTATTSNIVGQNECFEPFTANIYTRKTQAGEFIIINRHLVEELTQLGVWGDSVRRAIIREKGSVQGIEGIPADVKRRFRTARELDQRLLSLHAAARGAFICQTQSLNVYTKDVSMKAYASLMLKNWKLGLKTIWYYVHSTPATGGLMTAVSERSTAVQDEDADDGSDPTEGLPQLEPVLVCPRRKPGEAVCDACSV
ncbi:MAG: ribonucleoside-diphosphate reductase subunit alpha [Patescibacteria group bacterium]|nr:ribonucleoside-diphosphate reductase subunit alpha [Patescibacteria group bacterium]